MMAGVGFNVPTADGPALGDHELQQSDVQMSLGGRLLRGPPVSPVLRDVDGDMCACFLKLSQIARAWNRVTDIQVAKRATCVLVRLPDFVSHLALDVDEVARVEPDGCKVLMAFSEKHARLWKCASPIGLGRPRGRRLAARRRSTSIYENIQVQSPGARNCRIGAMPEGRDPPAPPSMWTEPSRETPRCRHVCEPCGPHRLGSRC